MLRIDENLAHEAAEYLSRVDPVLRPIIQRTGLCTIHSNTNYYEELVDAIISQQLSIHAARAIEQRFRNLFNGSFPTAEQILNVDAEALRNIGLSRAKASYVLDLAAHITAGTLQFDHLDLLTNEQVVAELIAVKGIGTWTAHMFLMFCMGRPDVLPVGDLGIRNGIRQLYGYTDVPTLDQITQLAEANRWHPYESIASWYVWRAIDGAPPI